MKNRDCPATGVPKMVVWENDYPFETVSPAVGGLTKREACGDRGDAGDVWRPSTPIDLAEWPASANQGGGGRTSGDHDVRRRPV